MTLSLHSEQQENVGPICKACLNPIPRRPGMKPGEWRNRKYCSKSCMDARRPSILTDYIVVESGCWEWQGYIDRNGYGKAYDIERPPGQRTDWAHRVSYRRHKGPIPEGFHLDHECENPPCINPDHLCAVTPVEHVRRTLERLGVFEDQMEAVQLRIEGLTYQQIADATGLAGYGSAHDRVKSAIANGLIDPDEVPRVVNLTLDDRRSIRALYALGVPQTEIAAFYNIDSSQASRVVNGKTSGHS